MKEDLRDKTILVIDYGNFLPVAERLARDYGRVLYYTPWETAFPKYHNYIIGSSVPGIQRIYNKWDYFDQVDLFFFTDLYQGDFQDWLRSQGKAVFGAGKGEEMEIYRDRMKGLQRSVGLPTNKYEIMMGLEGLREYLQDNDDKYVKTNLMRGHFESFHHENYMLTKPILDEWEHVLGIYKGEEIFIVEDPIDAIAEIGYDGFSIDGLYPDRALFGIEIKDCAYCGVVLDYEKLPKSLQDINAKLSDTFRAYGYRGSYTNEVRVGIDRVGYLIDQTCRQPEPPTCLQLEIFDNYSEIVWEIAHGRVPKIKNTFKYGAQIVIKSDWARTEPQAIYFPDQYKKYIKIKNLAIKEGVNYFVPQPGIEMEEIGAVLGLGRTLQEAIDQATTIAKDVKGYCIECNGAALSKAIDEIDKLKSAGIRVF